VNRVLSIILLVPGWVLYFFSNLSVRSTKIVAFGVHTNSFSGNSKQLFLTSNSECLNIFISSNKVLVTKLQGKGYKAYAKYSLYGIYYALRAGTYVYSQYPSDINFWLSGGAKYINVWHGTPIKKIERDISTGYYSSRNKYKWFFKLIAPYLFARADAFLVSSAYEEHCFMSAFDMGDGSFVRAFPPRLKALAESSEDRCTERNVLYVPTWRDDHSFRFEDYVDMESFNGFLKENRIIFYIKHHPSDRVLDNEVAFPNIIAIGRNEDVYDFLKDADALVSDYSSMIFESLYILRPAVLFCPDYDHYQKNARTFYIDPRKDLPVKVFYTQAELEQGLLCALKERQLDIKKIEPFRPYPVQERVLEQLMAIAHK